MFGANVASKSNVPFSAPHIEAFVVVRVQLAYRSARDELWVESNVAQFMATDARSFQIWEPMETAPLDGTPIVVKNEQSQATVSWSSEMHSWVVGLATEPDLPNRILPWRPLFWIPVAGALE